MRAFSYLILSSVPYRLQSTRELFVLAVAGEPVVCVGSSAGSVPGQQPMTGMEPDIFVNRAKVGHCCRRLDSQCEVPASPSHP